MNKTVIILLFFAIFSGCIFSNAGTALGEIVSGWAWSNMDDSATPADERSIGWISLNCNNDYNDDGVLESHCIGAGYPVDYGVSIGSDGNFSGYAWSENIGWIDFAPAGPYPAVPAYPVCLDLPGVGQICDGVGDYKVSGWARALAFGGGWEGWVKFNGESYGVSLDPVTNNFSGYAWSDMVAGWIRFDLAKIVPFSSNQPPTAIILNATPSDYCFSYQPPIFLSWQFSDLDPGDTQSAYEVQIDTENLFLSPVIDSGKVPLASNTYAPIGLSFDNTTYFWRVKVWDSEDAPSNWAEGPAFITADHAYPRPDFTWSPSSPSSGEIVRFDPDISATFGGTTISDYLWTITQGTGVYVDGTDQNSQYPNIRFSTVYNKIKLKITDSFGYFCECDSKDITTKPPLPEYKEIPPVIWFKKIFAGVVDFFVSFDII